MGAYRNVECRHRQSRPQGVHSGRFAALKELHSEDVVYELHGFGTHGRWYRFDEMRPDREVHGRDAIVGIFAQLPYYCRTVVNEPSEYIDGGEYVGVLGTQRFTDNKDSEEFPFVLVLRFDCGGKVARVEFHVDNVRLPVRETEQHNAIANKSHWPAMTFGMHVEGEDVQQPVRRSRRSVKSLHAMVT